MHWPCFEQNGHHVLRETTALPSFTQCDNVSLCLGRIIGSNSVDFRVGCFILTPFGCRVTRTSRAVMCVSTETRKNVTNHRGQSQNKQSGFEQTCPTCAHMPRQALLYMVDTITSHGHRIDKIYGHTNHRRLTSADSSCLNLCRK